MCCSDGFCKSYTAAAKVNGYTNLQAFSASALETALANTGPVAVSVAAGCWQLYRGGIYTVDVSLHSPLGFVTI